MAWVRKICHKVYQMWQMNKARDPHTIHTLCVNFILGIGNGVLCAIIGLELEAAMNFTRCDMLIMLR